MIKTTKPKLWITIKQIVEIKGMILTKQDVRRLCHENVVIHQKKGKQIEIDFKSFTDFLFSEQYKEFVMSKKMRNIQLKRYIDCGFYEYCLDKAAKEDVYLDCVNFCEIEYVKNKNFSDFF
jgi:predicted RNA-binding protein associated with RNAse of E/G family